jgi:hypothetical protein
MAFGGTTHRDGFGQCHTPDSGYGPAVTSDLSGRYSSSDDSSSAAKSGMGIG